MNPKANPYFISHFYFQLKNSEEIKTLTTQFIPVGENPQTFEPEVENHPNPLYRTFFALRGKGFILRAGGLFNRVVFHWIQPMNPEALDRDYRISRGKISSLSIQFQRKFEEKFIGQSEMVLIPNTLLAHLDPHKYLSELTGEKEIHQADLTLGRLFQLGKRSDKNQKFALLAESTSLPFIDTLCRFFSPLDYPAHHLQNLFLQQESLGNSFSDIFEATQTFHGELKNSIHSPGEIYQGDRLQEMIDLDSFHQMLQETTLKLSDWSKEFSKGMEIFQQTLPTLFQKIPGKSDQIFSPWGEKNQKLKTLIHNNLESLNTLKNENRDLQIGLISLGDCAIENLALFLKHLFFDPHPPHKEKFLPRFLEEFQIDPAKLSQINSLEFTPPQPLPLCFLRGDPAECFSWILENCKQKGDLFEREKKVLSHLAEVFSLPDPLLSPLKGFPPQKNSENSSSTPSGTARFTGSAVKILDKESMKALADRELKEKRFTTAKEFLKILVNTYPDDPESLLNLGRCYLFLDNVSRGDEVFKLLSHQFKHPLAPFYLTGISLSQGGAALLPNEFNLDSLPLDDLLWFYSLLSLNGDGKVLNDFETKAFTLEKLKSRFPERYQGISLLGKGGMGVVFSAHDSILDIEVALKLIRPALASNPDLKNSLLTEGRFMALLNSHPNSVQVFDIVTEGLPYVVMAKISGKSVFERMQEEPPLKKREVKEIILQILSFLHFAHVETGRGMVHRDLKPENIMLDPKGHVFVADFGLAEFESNLKVEERVVGTPAYMSPEQFQGQKIDQRTDLYSTGLILIRLLTGSLPFDGTWFRKIVVDPDSTHINGEGLPQEWIELLLKCIRRDPENRFQTAKEISLALQKITS